MIQKLKHKSALTFQNRSANGPKTKVQRYKKGPKTEAREHENGSRHQKSKNHHNNIGKT